MQEKRRTIGYICPKCRQSVVADRSLFSLSVGHMKLACPCGQSALEVDYLGSAYRFTVPCAACGGSHTVQLTSGQLMGHKLLGLSCPSSGIDCCYLGEEGPVFAAMPRLEQTLDKQEEAPAGGERTFLDETVMAEVLAELRDIAARGGISCTCGSHRWRLQIRYSAVELHCADCGGTLRLPAATVDDLTDLCAKPKLLIHGRT
ncbi:MAG TPA: hypothetical protein IAC15_00365 [Candidatus Onthomonas avicola]|nr:hypothetical protein [Candidatus Onthomonas avicola]